MRMGFLKFVFMFGLSADDFQKLSISTLSDMITVIQCGYIRMHDNPTCTKYIL